MELSQQVKNFEATQRQLTAVASKQRQALASPEIERHQDALQELSNGLAPAYASTLRVVRHDGSRAPRAAPAKTMKPPGYCRNVIGGFYTS
ncbi:hypothetical protein Rsub_05307 [Raphidocelis subcapitata]|uniref:Uncharacterized protein n=1 Tax=Raphidocelis subcapitata TaxID=307507 RepID=A0A2V0P565_9CHLO|nr:hypothetical protein Rsub_05307 [Raphidocelis subcapitata]|eukprot:GBF92225.1 hypothetical protein Rsub_05307 [Raphidocelis subcapitata]